MKQDIINSTSKFIITIHGYRVCRYRSESMLPSTMLYHMGYNILQVDLRNHGDSGVYAPLPYVSFGNFEHLDILGAMDYILARYPFLNKTNSIGLFGTSMVCFTESRLLFTFSTRIIVNNFNFRKWS